MGLLLHKSIRPATAGVLAVAMASMAPQQFAWAQQASPSTGTFNPLEMRRIPGTDMPSLRGSQDSLAASPAGSVSVQVSDFPAQNGDPQAGQNRPIALSETEQGRAVRQPQVPAVNPQLPPRTVSTIQTPETTGAIPVQPSSADAFEIQQNPRIGRDQSGTGPIVEQDPFAATGFRMGTSVVNVRLEQAIGYATNVEQASDGQAGGFSQTNLTVSAVSDWSRHELRLDASGSYRKFFDSEEGNRPTANVRSALRLDLIDGFTSTIVGNYSYTTESLTSDNLSDNVTERPGIHTYGLDLELARSQRKLNFLLRGSLERTQYEEAALSDGSALDQVDRNLNTYRLTGRVGYDTGAVATPFVEGSVGWRRFDEETDRNGDRRNSMIYDLRTGLAFDGGEKLNGEIAIGYLREEFEEGALETLEGYSLNGSLIWSPVRDTTVTLNAATRLNSSTTAGDNGSIEYTAGLDITRQATDRLELNANTDLTLDVDEQNDETDVTWTAGVGAQYWINRHLAVSADLDFTRFEDGDGLEDYTDTTATLGMVLQR